MRNEWDIKEDIDFVTTQLEMYSILLEKSTEPKMVEQYTKKVAEEKARLRQLEYELEQRRKSPL